MIKRVGSPTLALRSCSFIKSTLTASERARVFRWLSHYTSLLDEACRPPPPPPGLDRFIDGRNPSRRIEEEVANEERYKTSLEIPFDCD